jgi:hypothetical protein
VLGNWLVIARSTILQLAPPLVGLHVCWYTVADGHFI